MRTADQPFEPGDRVRVLAGKHQDKQGVVQTYQGDRCVVQFDFGALAGAVENLALVALAQNSAHPETRSVCGNNGAIATAEAVEIPHTLEPPVCAELKDWIYTETYLSHGTIYARLRWGKGSKTFGYCHINGGAANNPAVVQRREAIDVAIASGVSLGEILVMTRQFSAGRRGRKKF